jgi:transmembrane sensor
MNKKPQTDADRTARDEAVAWFARLQLGALTPAEQARFDAWRAASPENDRHCRALESIWSAAGQLPRDQMRTILKQTDRPPLYRRRDFLWGMGAAATAAVAAGVVLPTWLQEPAAYTTEVASRHGERRTVTLPDGSILTLNTDTRASVAYYSGRRVVRLEAGEILFSVQPDKARPFTVVAGAAEVLVTGTVFNVRREGVQTTVAVESGTVRFSSGSWWDRQTTQLTAGLYSRLDGAQRVMPAQRGNVAALIAWQRGRLIFPDTPLATAVAELNRYLVRPLRIADPSLGSLRIAGTFNIDDPDAMLDALPSIAPVRVKRDADGAIITSR